MSNINIITGNPNPREQNSATQGLFLLDRFQTSFVSLFALTKDFVSKKDTQKKWIDFYAGGVGTTLQQLMAGHSEYDAYQAITARRESYLFENKIQSSAVGIASAMGYSAFRGVNQQLILTFIPGEDKEVETLDIVGGVGEYDIISLENKSFRYGTETDLKVVLGKLMEETIQVPDSNTHFFRFNSPNVSETIKLLLNNAEIEYSRDILELLNDKFVTLSNSVGGIDIFYLNRFPPTPWSSLTRYTYFDYISPNYSRRSFFSYLVGQYCISTSDFDFLPIFYKCIQAGISTDKEPVWNTETGDKTIDGDIIWECIGRLEQQRYFSSRTPGIGQSGIIEPVWPIIVGEKIIENDIEWICVDNFGESKYPYDTGDIITLRYIESDNVPFTDKDLKLDIGQIIVITSSTNYQGREDIASIQINAPLYHETQKLVRGREDYRKLFKLLAPNIVDANGFDVTPAVVRLTYVKNHTSNTWEYNILVDKGHNIMPSKPNNFIYSAINTGRTATNNNGITGLHEPVWNVALNALTFDNEIVWQTVPLNVSITIDTWSPSERFSLNSFCKSRVITTNVMFKMIDVSKEPVWPTKIGEKVTDNEVTWECIDTIYLTGYTADFYTTDTFYEQGKFVKPVNPNGYFYKAINSGTSSFIEPDWPTVICDTVIDGTLVWECYDLLESSLYVKNMILRELPKYRPYGVEPNELSDPKLINIQFTLELTLTTVVDILTVRNDIDTLLKNYQKILGISLTANDIENVIEQNLNYVYVARALLGDNTKTQIWEPGLQIKENDVVIPTKPNGYFYKCQLVTLGSSNYTSWEDRGYSGAEEPKWSSIIGDIIEDEYLVWEMRPRSEFPLVPNTWKPNTIYLKDSSIIPNDITIPLFAKLIEIKFKEPDWPTIPGKSVKDNKLFWVCLDPTSSIVPLAWDEYYIFTRNIVIKQR